ncbi:MAG: hypothetical protein AAGI07_19285, partial [Bacteroidota bacterium]
MQNLFSNLNSLFISKFLLYLVIPILFSLPSYAQYLGPIQVNGQIGDSFGRVHLDCGETMFIHAIASWAPPTGKAKYTWTLYRNGVKYHEYEEENSNPNYFPYPILFTYNSAFPGTFKIKVKIKHYTKSKKPPYVNVWVLITEETTNEIIVNAPTANASFKINGSTSSNQIICDSENIILDGQASSCESKYRIKIQRLTGTTITKETAWYNDAQVPSNINLKSIGNSIGVPLTVGNTYRITLEVGELSHSRSADITILSNLVPSTFLNINGSENLCVGETRTYSVANIPSATYSWNIPPNMSVTSSPNNYTRVLRANSSGTYSVSVAVGNICNGSRNPYKTGSITTSKPYNVSIVPPPGGHCISSVDTYYAQAALGTTYQWSYTGSLCILGSSNGQTAVVGASGSGTLYLRVSNGCGSASEVSYYVSPNFSCGGGSSPCGGYYSSVIEDITLHQEDTIMQVSPNPLVSLNELVIDFTSTDLDTSSNTENLRTKRFINPELKEISLTDATTGKAYYPEFTTINPSKYQLKTKSIPAGVYILNV